MRDGGVTELLVQRAVRARTFTTLFFVSVSVSVGKVLDP